MKTLQVDDHRTRVIDALAKALDRHPEQRAGQIIVNAVLAARDNREPFDSSVLFRLSDAGLAALLAAPHEEGGSDGVVWGPKLDNEQEAIEASQGEALGDDPGVVLREPLTLIARGDFEGCRDEVVSMLNENGLAAISGINEQNRSVMFKVPGSKTERATLTLYASGKATTGGKQTSAARTALRDIADSLGFDVRS